MSFVSSFFVISLTVYYQTTKKQANRHLYYSTNICTSIIAIAGTPDQSSNNTEDVYDHGEEFECELSTGLTVSVKGQDSQIVQLQDMLNNGTFISGQMTVGVADDLLSVNGDESVFLPPGDIILTSRGR